MRPWVILFTTIALVTAPVAAQTNRVFVRVVVLDTSGSMSGQRIATAKAELLALARHLPPTKDRPLILVPFHDSPHDVGGFTDLPTFEAHLTKLQAGGGTSIASGLTHALQELTAHASAGSLSLFLITDGEDGDQKGIDAAEEKLDALFAVRKKQGLPSSVVFKRWEQANAQLLHKIAGRGNARVIDAKDFRLVPVTLTPSVKVLRSTWVNQQPPVLEAECQARVGVTGIGFDPSFPATSLACTNVGASLAPVMLRVGDPNPVSFRVRLPISTAAAAAGQTTAHFTVGAINSFALPNGLVLPQMPTERLDVPVPLPPPEFRCSLSGTVVPANPPTWSDALSCKPIRHLTLTCTVRSVPDQPWPRPVTLRVKPEGCRLASTKDSLEFVRSGSLSLPLSLESGSVPTGSSAFRVAFRLQPDLPPGFTIEPPDLRLAHEGPLPPPVTTRIDAAVQAMSESRWCDLRQGIAAFDAQVRFTIDGPMLPDTKLVLLCPSSVRTVVADPPVVHTGTQTVKLSFTAVLPPAPAVETMRVKIQPPAATGAVSYAPPAPIALRVPGPAAVQLALVNPDGASPSVTVRDREAPVLLAGVPVLLQQVDAALAAGVSVLVRGRALLGSKTHGPLPLNTLTVLPLSLQNPDSSFFFDTLIDEDIEVLPAWPSPALVGSQQRCIVTLEAPFKRLFFYAASALSAILILLLLMRVLMGPASPHPSPSLAQTLPVIAEGTSGAKS